MPGASPPKTTHATWTNIYQQKEGIAVDPIMIHKNPGRKARAKLMLNSFWGKFGENPVTKPPLKCSRSLRAGLRSTPPHTPSQNQVDKTELSCYTHHRRSTTVFLEAYLVHYYR